uniref:Uncharacterized protein n=1 Tax=Anopheles atroparvus TaxID=41427 RepID=A0A182IQI0_ANOAO
MSSSYRMMVNGAGAGGGGSGNSSGSITRQRQRLTNSSSTGSSTATTTTSGPFPVERAGSREFAISRSCQCGTDGFCSNYTTPRHEAPSHSLDAGVLYTTVSVTEQ